MLRLCTHKYIHTYIDSIGPYYYIHTYIFVFATFEKIVVSFPRYPGILFIVLVIIIVVVVVVTSSLVHYKMDNRNMYCMYVHVRICT